MIWEPFLLALILGLLMSAGLYFAYLWPSVEPLDEDEAPGSPPSASAAEKDDDGEDDPSADAEDEPASVAT